MTRFAYALLALLALITAGSAILAAPAQPPAQQQPLYPGQPTKPSVWVENRGKTEAVPVTIQDASSDASLRVQVAGTPTVNVSSTVQARIVRQPWDYHTEIVRDGQDPEAALQRLGSDGWEVTGVLQTRVSGGIAILLKRPRT